MGKPGAPVLRIEDPSLLEVSVFLPAQAYGEVAPGETGMQVLVEGLDLGQHKVTYKSPTIDPVLRTFEARCLLADPPGGRRAGRDGAGYAWCWIATRRWVFRVTRSSAANMARSCLWPRPAWRGWSRFDSASKRMGCARWCRARYGRVIRWWQRAATSWTRVRRSKPRGVTTDVPLGRIRQAACRDGLRDHRAFPSRPQCVSQDGPRAHAEDGPALRHRHDTLSRRKSGGDRDRHRQTHRGRGRRQSTDSSTSAHPPWRTCA